MQTLSKLTWHYIEIPLQSLNYCNQSEIYWKPPKKFIFCTGYLADGVAAGEDLLDLRALPCRLILLILARFLELGLGLAGGTGLGLGLPLPLVIKAGVVGRRRAPPPT